MSEEDAIIRAQQRVRLAKAAAEAAQRELAAAKEGLCATFRERGRLPVYTERQVEQVALLLAAGHSTRAICRHVTPPLTYDQVRSIAANPTRARARARLAAAYRD